MDAIAISMCLPHEVSAACVRKIMKNRISWQVLRANGRPNELSKPGPHKKLVRLLYYITTRNKTRRSNKIIQDIVYM